MITIELDGWDERDLQNKVADKLTRKIVSNEFKLYGDIPKEGCFTPYDKFKNYIANLVADRIFKYMVENDEIQKRIDNAIENAEKTIIAFNIKKIKSDN